MEFDDVFEHVGGFGIYQVCLYLMTGLTVFYAGWQHMGMAILGAPVEHWCETNITADVQYAYKKYATIPFNEEDQMYAECEAYDRDVSMYNETELCLGDIDESVTSTVSCSAWEYDRTEFAEIPVMRYNLVCDDDYLVALSSTFYLMGVLVGSVLSGILSDRFGRYPILIFGSIGHLTVSLLAAYMPTYWSFTIMRFFVGAFAHGTYICGFVILMESTGPKYRSISGVLFPMNFSYGYLVLPMMAFFVREQTALLLCMAMPIASSLCYIFMIPESPRWLVTRGRFDEAKEIVQYMAEVNGNSMPDKYEFTQTETIRIPFMSMFKVPVLRRELIIMYICWFSNSFLYYGLGLNAGAAGANIFLSVFIGGLVEVPGQIVGIFIIYYIGRRATFGYCFIIAAIAMFASAFIIGNEDLAIGVMVLVSIAKACIKVTFTVGYIYTAELFPTPVRHLAVGSSSMMSRFGGILAPFVGGPLLDVWAPLPPLLFGASSLLSGVLALFLPETRGRVLPDTIEQAVQLADKSHHPGVEVEINANDRDNKENPMKSTSGDVLKDKHKPTPLSHVLPMKHSLKYADVPGSETTGIYNAISENYVIAPDNVVSYQACVDSTEPSMLYDEGAYSNVAFTNGEMSTEF